MRYSDGAIVPGNARIDAAEIADRRERFWAPYRRTIEATVEAMLATGEPPALVSIHSFTPVWRGAARRWKVGVLWDRDDRIPRPLLAALHAEPDLHAHGIGDNEPYDGALAGDTIDAVATARGLANALIEIRQDLIDDPAGALAWAERFARLLKPILADRRRRERAASAARAARGGEADFRKKTGSFRCPTVTEPTICCLLLTGEPYHFRARNQCSQGLAATFPAECNSQFWPVPTNEAGAGMSPPAEDLPDEGHEAPANAARIIIVALQAFTQRLLLDADANGKAERNERRNGRQAPPRAENERRGGHVEESAEIERMAHDRVRPGRDDESARAPSGSLPPAPRSCSCASSRT